MPPTRACHGVELTRVGRCHCGAESDVVLVQCHYCWFATQILQLGEDVEDGHGGVPPHEGMIVWKKNSPYTSVYSVALLPCGHS